MKRPRVAFHVEYDRSGRIIRTLYRSADPTPEDPAPRAATKPEEPTKVARGVQGELL